MGFHASRLRLLCAVLTAAAVTGILGCADSGQPEFDLLVRGGSVIDGSGSDSRQTDVGVRDGRIVAVGELSSARARRVIDASGLIVAPGFIDMHSHADLILLANADTQNRLLSARLRQGVTTVLVGNCGLGLAPVPPEAERILSEINAWMTPLGVHAGALSVAQYLDRLDEAGIALNVGTLVPHGPVRISAMGLSAGKPTDEQLQTMADQISRGLDAGAFGLSTGLIYPPGMYSATDELVALARPVARRDRLFTSHVRGSSETLLEATAELVAIARESGARVHHSHLEAVGETFWPDVARVLELEDAARAEGLRVSHDVFPYTRAATMMSAIFPPWSLEGGIRLLLERLQDPVQRRRIRRELEERVPEWPPWQPGGWPHNLVGAVGWDGIRVASVGPDGPSAWIGRSLAEIAAERGDDPFDVVADLMISQQGQVGQLVDEISGRVEKVDTLLAIMEHPSAAIVSDAEDYGRGFAHPAHAGAFARVLRLARERSWPLADVVRRMTAFPASLIGLDDRGGIREGAAADLVLFDAGAVTDAADWSDPRRSAVGIAWVVLNGKVVVERGRYLEGMHGQVLRARSAR